MARCFFIAIPLHDNRPMRHCANRHIQMTDYANRATVATHYTFLFLRCRCILHNGADCMSGLKPFPCLLCILQRRFDYARHFCPILWTIKPGTRSRHKLMCRQ